MVDCRRNSFFHLQHLAEDQPVRSEFYPLATSQLARTQTVCEAICKLVLFYVKITVASCNEATTNCGILLHRGQYTTILVISSMRLELPNDAHGALVRKELLTSVCCLLIAWTDVTSMKCHSCKISGASYWPAAFHPIPLKQSSQPLICHILLSLRGLKSRKRRLSIAESQANTNDGYSHV